MKHLLITIVAVLWVGCVMNQPPKNTRTQAPILSIHSAAHQGSIEAVKQHLAAGTDVNAKNENVFTPLHSSAMHDHKEIAELLIAKGADVNSKNAQGWTPLDLATVPGSPFETTQTADLLRKHGGKTSEELKAAGN